MPERLTDSLVHKGLVTQQAANEAIDRLVLMGGALDTCLLELRLVDEDTIVHALSEAYGMEAATAETWHRMPDERAVRSFPEQWAKKHGLAPIEVNEQGLRVLSPAPADLDALQRLGELLELTILPVLAPEFRVQQRLSQLYGSRPPERFQALLDQYGDAMGALSPPASEPTPAAMSNLPSSIPGPSIIGAASADEAGLSADHLPDEVSEALDRIQDFGPEEPPAPDEPAERSPPTDEPVDLPEPIEEGEIATKRGLWFTHPPDAAQVAENWADSIEPRKAEAVTASAQPEPAEPNPNPMAPGPSPMTFAEGVATLGRAQSPDDIAATALAYAHQWLRFVALLRLEGSSLRGWMAQGPQAEAIHSTDLDLDEESAFKVVADTRTHYLGPLPSDATHGQFLAQLQRPPPRMVLIVPIRSQTKTISLLYADDAEANISPRLVADLLLFFTHVQVELETFAGERESTPLMVPPSVTARRAEINEAPPALVDEDRPPLEFSSSPPDPYGLPEPTPILEPLDGEKPIPLLEDSSDIIFIGESSASGALEAKGASSAPIADWQPAAVEIADRSEGGPEDVRSGAVLPGFPDAPYEPTTEPADILPPQPVSPLSDALQTLPDGRLQFSDHSSAMSAEGSDGSDLLAALDSDRVQAFEEPAPIDSGSWVPADADSWDDQHEEAPSPALTPPPAVETMRRSLREDATVPDLSAEAWIRASSEQTRAKPLSADVVHRSELPEPDGAEQPVPLTKVAVSRRTVPVGPLGRLPPPHVIVAGDNEPDSDLLDLDEVLAEPQVADPRPLSAEETATALLEQLHSDDLQTRARATDALARGGPDLMPRLMEHFPGALDIDPFGPGMQLPAFSKCGPLLAVLERSGPDAHRFILDRLEAPEPIQRFFAIYYYAAVYVPEAIPKLIQRLHDEEPRISMLAARTLFSYRDHRDFTMALEHLHGRLTANSLPARRHAAYLLGLLRDVTAIPRLIDILARRDRGVQSVVEDALAEITKQRLGSSSKRWRAWWTKNQQRSRIEWLLEGLASKDVELRRSASEELRAVTGMDLGYDGGAPRRQREEARQRWQKWWKAQQAKRAVTLA